MNVSPADRRKSTSYTIGAKCILLLILVSAGLQAPDVYSESPFIAVNTVDELISHFVNDPRIAVSNVSWSGNKVAVAKFESVNFGVQDGVTFALGSGLHLSSGMGDVPLENTSPSWGFDNGGGRDLDLEEAVELGDLVTDNAFWFAFDFTVVSGYEGVEFDFMFGSEEYPEFVDGRYVDGAAIIVNGVNYARFPNGAFLKVVSEADLRLNESLGIEYNGMSPPQRVSAPIQPSGAVNHIKVVIADTSDKLYASGLFLARMRPIVSGGGGIETELILSPSGREHSAMASTGQIDVTANMSWSATVGANSWISITDGSTGSGSGSISYSVSANTTGQDREGTITVSGGGLVRTFSVVQKAAQAADLRILSITLVPAQPLPGQEFKANVQVVNEGQMPVPGAWLDVWVDRSDPASLLEMGDAWQNIGALAAGHNRSYEFTLIAPTAPGNYTLQAFVDSLGQVDELNKDNNHFFQSYTVPAVYPDFVITALSVSPVNPVPGEPCTVTTTIANQGAGQGNAGWLDVWMDRVPPANCGDVGDYWRPVGVLASGETLTITIPATAPTEPGTWSLRAFVDSTCQTQEEDETNNQRQHWVESGGRPDFAVQAISISPSSPTEGETFTAYVTVGNQGQVAASGGWLDLWTDQPASVSCPAVGNRWLPIGVLAAGESRVYTFTGLTAPPTGTRVLRVHADSFCTSDDNNRGNNQGVLTYTSVPVFQALPDFSISSIALNPSSPVSGESFTVGVVVSNAGATANARWLDVWRNQSAEAACGMIGDRWVFAGIIPQGQTRTYSFSMTAGAPGAATLRAFVDSSCSVEESNETNNQRTHSYTVQQPVTQGPDFIITEITMSPPNPAPGQQFSAAIRVRNQGNQAANGGWLDVWVHRPQPANCGEEGDGYAQVGVLAQNEERLITIANLRAPEGYAGIRTLRAKVDSFCTTEELDETNNQDILNYQSDALEADLELLSLQASPASMSIGDTFDAVQFVIKNHGGSALNAANRHIRLDLVLSRDGVWGAQGNVTLGSQTLTTFLAPGNTSTLTLDSTEGFEIPPGANGTYYLLGRIQHAAPSNLTDPVPANNVAVMSGTLQVAGAGALLPDFTIRNIVISPPAPRAGRTFTAYVTVVNEGTGEGDARALNVWTHRPEAVACAEVGDGSVSAGMLNPGESRIIQVPGLTAPETAGEFTLRAFIDGGCSTPESNSENNQATLDYYITLDRWDYTVVAKYENVVIGSNMWNELKTEFRRASNFLMDATDGQFRFGTMRMRNWNAVDAALAQAVIKLDNIEGAYANFGGQGVGRVVLGLNHPYFYSYGTIVHELGHYEFALGDSYTVYRVINGEWVNANTHPELRRYNGFLPPARGRTLMEQQYTPWSTGRGSSEFTTPSGPNSARRPIDAAGEPSLTHQCEHNNEESDWETIARYSVAVVMPDGDPLPGPCSQSDDPDSELSHVPLPEDEGVGPLVVFDGP